MMSKDERLYEQLSKDSSRVKKLEDACRRQETVIMEMEKQLAEKVSRSGNLGEI